MTIPWQWLPLIITVCAKWTKEFYAEQNKELPTIFVHSMNPVGTKNILNLFL